MAQILRNRLKGQRPEIRRRLSSGESRYGKIMEDYNAKSVIAWDRFLDEECGLRGKGYKVWTHDIVPEVTDIHEKLTTYILKLKCELAQKDAQLSVKGEEIKLLKARLISPDKLKVLEAICD